MGQAQVITGFMRSLKVTPEVTGVPMVRTIDSHVAGSRFESPSRQIICLARDLDIGNLLSQADACDHYPGRGWPPYNALGYLDGNVCCAVYREVYKCVITSQKQKYRQPLPNLNRMKNIFITMYSSQVLELTHGMNFKAKLIFLICPVFFCFFVSVREYIVYSYNGAKEGKNTKQM